jgi:hypothetical protein
MKIAKKAWVAAGGAITFFISNIALAQSAVTLCDPLGTNCQPGGESFASIATNVTQFLVEDIAIPLVVIMVLVGAFQIMTSGGDPEKFSTGRNTVTYAVIGFGIALIGLGIVSIIKSFLGQ